MDGGEESEMRDEKGGRSGWGRGEWPQRIGEMKKVAGE